VDILWDEQKSERLRKERGISLDQVAALILEKKYVDILKNPKRPGQLMFVIPINGYMHVVPFVVDAGNNFVLKTVYPGRKFHKKYGGEKA
jgi:uncharacterized DUF497 family protein